MLQPAPHESDGLPFIGRSRLRDFLARWEGNADVEEQGLRLFLEEYFRAQEEAYHVLLDLVSQISYHLDFWLDRITPTHRRPLWLGRVAGRLTAFHLTMLGWTVQLASPEATVRKLKRLHGELCRLLAFTQVSAFSLLLLDIGEVERLAEAMCEVSQHLASQARSAEYLAVAASWPLPSSSSLPALPGVRGARPAQGSHEAPGSPGPRGALKAALRSCHLQLEESRAAMREVVRSLAPQTRQTGRLQHLSRYLSVYALLALAGASWTWVNCRDRASRAELSQRVWAVCQQFYSEWIRDPLESLCFELFRRLAVDDSLQSQLKELRSQEEVLERMIVEFASIVKADPTFADQCVVGTHMNAAERYFEDSLNNPISKTFQGHLVESCMVQMQRMKVLMYASMFSMDSVLLQLKWDFLMAGIMPIFSLGYFVCWTAACFRRYRVLDWRRRMIRAIAGVERFLNRNLQPTSGHKQAAMVRQSSSMGAFGPLRSPSGVALEEAGLQLSMLTPGAGEHFEWPPGGELSDQLERLPSVLRPSGAPQGWLDGQVMELEKVGAALSHLDVLYRLVSHVRLEAVDWRAFRRDILDLASPELSVGQKLQVVTMMRGTYDVFHLGWS